MPKVQPDLQKFAIISAAVTGIGLFWWQITNKCSEAVISIVKNQLFVDSEDVEKNKKIREQIENICSLLEQMIEDLQKMIKALQDGEAFQELGNKIIEKNTRMCLELKKLNKDLEDVHKLENETKKKIMRIKYYTSEYRKIYEELVKNMQECRNAQEGEEGEDVQQLLTRLLERKHLEDEKIRLFVKY